jgi:hypothetical protein
VSSPLLHSPADVLRRLFIAVGLGTNPTASPLGTWPIYATGEPGSPDEVLTVYDTAGSSDGRSMVDGEMFQHYGFQLRIRAATAKRGYEKAESIRRQMAEVIYNEVVTIDDAVYRIPCIVRIGDVLALGKETPQSKRSLFTINALAPIHRLA